MKKRNIQSLQLHKKSIANMTQLLKGGTAIQTKMINICVDSKQETKNTKNLCNPAQIELPINPYPVDYGG